MVDISSRIRSFTQRVLDQSQIRDFFSEPDVKDSQQIARELAEAGDRVVQMAQVFAEVEILNQLHNRLVGECEGLRYEKSNLETQVMDLNQERNDIEPQVFVLRDELQRATSQLDQTQQRERMLSDRERQLTDIVAQLERRRAVLNQAIENLTTKEADYIVRTQELSKTISDREQHANQLMEAVNHFNTTIAELKGQAEEEIARLKALGIEPTLTLPVVPEPPVEEPTWSEDDYDDEYYDDEYYDDEPAPVSEQREPQPATWSSDPWQPSPPPTTTEWDEPQWQTGPGQPPAEEPQWQTGKPQEAPPPSDWSWGNSPYSDPWKS